MPLSHYRWYIPQLEGLPGGQIASKVTPFCLSFSHYRRCNLWLICKTPLPFNCHPRFVCDLMSQWQNVLYLNSRYVAVLHRKTTKSQSYVHCRPYHSKKSSSHAHSTKPEVGLDGRFATLSQGAAGIKHVSVMLNKYDCIKLLFFNTV